MSGTVCLPPGAVEFSYSNFIALYPMFSTTVNATQGESYFNQAGLYFDNGPCSPVRDNRPLGARAQILYLITAHLAALFSGINGSPPSLTTGRVSSATEGSVSVSFEMPTNPNNAWWYQTQWGMAAWQAMLPFRSGGRYYQGNIPYLGVGGYPSGLLGRYTGTRRF